MMKKLLVSLLLLPSIGYLGAQVQVLPLTENAVLSAYSAQHPNEAKALRPLAPLTLPFFDDFAQGRPYPNSVRWVANNQIWVNDGMAADPSSIGMATFDGLKGDGKPYKPNASTTSSLSADTLSSQQISLQGQTRVYLYLEIQPKGYGDKPEVLDSLVLEFRNSSGAWEMQKYYIADSMSVDTFVGDTVIIDEARFLYSTFQFRLRNKATTNGFNDIWNVDYVRLDQNDPAGGIFNDLAAVRPFRSVIKRYVGMPLSHLKGNFTNFLDSEPVLEVYNHDASPKGLSQGTLTIKETTTNTTLFSSNLLNVPGASIPSRESVSFPLSAGYDWTTVNYAAIDNFTGDSAVLQTDYTFTANGGDAISTNNSFKVRSPLQNYFSYDDGTAESRIAAQGVGTSIALEFMPLIDDTLRGITMHLPFYRGYIGVTDYINLKIWKGSLSNEVLSEDFVQPRDFFYQNYMDSLNAFWTYRLSEPIALSANETFYVGWQQGSGTEIALGYDRAHPEAAEYIHLNYNGSWVRMSEDSINPVPHGAIMMRPIVGQEPVVFTQTGTVQDKFALRLYPNPVNGVLNIDTPETVDMVQVTNAMGQVVLQLSGQKLVDMSSLSEGLYFVTVETAKGERMTQHIVKTN